MNDCFPGEGRKKITSLFNNDRRYNRSGSITTASNDKGDPIRQSRIMNLPDYKKQTMECRLDFVVVFQTMEIERLSVQIESLRVRLADSQRQMFNYKNYQVQIKELTERCFELEMQRSQYEQQIVKLDMALKDTTNSFDLLTEKYNNLDDQLRQQQDQAFTLKEKLILEQKQREQSEEGRLMLQSTIKEKQRLYSRQMKDLEKSTQLRRVEPSKNQQHLGNLLKKYHEEVSTLQKQNLDLRKIYDSIEHQSHELERKYEELQQQLFQNNEQLKEKDFELQSVEQENRERLDILQQRYQEEYNNKCRRVQECEVEINDWKIEVQKLEIDQERLQSKIGEYGEQCQKYEALLNQAGDQIDRLNTIVKDKIKYLQAWQGRYNQLQDKLNEAEHSLTLNHQKNTSDQQQILKVSHALKFQSEQLARLEKTRQQEAMAVKEKLQEIQLQRQAIASIKREKDQEREEQRRKELQMTQLKQQLSKRVVEGNKLFETLNSTEVQLKQVRFNLAATQTALHIKDQDLIKVKEELATVDHRIEKLQNQKRIFEQDAMRVKALEERIRHEESKKNEYLNECKKLSHKLKQNEKQLAQSRRKGRQLESDLSKLQHYSQQLISQIKQLQEKLEIAAKLSKEIAALLKKSQKQQQQISNLKELIDKKGSQINRCKQKLVMFDKLVRELKAKDQEYQQQLQNLSKLEGELRQLKGKYQVLQDKNDKLECLISSATMEIEELTKENGSLERVIQINSDELKRGEMLLAGAREDAQNHLSREKQLHSKLKQSEKKISQSNKAIQKQKQKILKEKQEVQKSMNRKKQQLEAQIKGLQALRGKDLQDQKRLIKSKQTERKELMDENNELRLLIKKQEEQNDSLGKRIRELEKMGAAYEHELQRNAESHSQAKKQLIISKNNVEKMNSKVRETEGSLREQSQRLGELLSEKERLLAQIIGHKKVVAGKEQQISELLNSNKRLEGSISQLREEISVQQERYSSLCEDLIRVKFQAEQLTCSYSSLSLRLPKLQKMIMDLKFHTIKTIELSNKLQVEKKELEKKYLEYQQRLTNEIQRLEEEQYKAEEQIIRLDTLNRIFQIQIGEYKERESAVFSIVREGSLLKQRKQLSPLRDIARTTTPEKKRGLNSQSKKTSAEGSRALDKSNLKVSRLLKSSIFGEANQMLKSRCVTTQQEEDLLQFSDCEKKEASKGDNPLQKSRPLYFQNLLFKPV